MSTIMYVRPVHLSILQIKNNSTILASYDIKRVYKYIIRVFHEGCGVKEALAQQFVTDVEEQYIIFMKNRSTNQFTGNIIKMLVYLLAMNRKISPIYLNNF